MDPRYQAWIDAQGLPDYPVGLCYTVSTKMAEAFPELVLTRGHVTMPCPDQGLKRWPHWWLVAPDGSIVDPTAAQFPGATPKDYEEEPPNAEEPTGKCLECGAYTYRGDSFCSVVHERSYMAYIMDPRRY